MTSNKNDNAIYEPDSMIQNATALQRVAKELNGLSRPNSDPLLFEGEFLAVPILLSLATEITLKAWQCRERQEAPDRSHDLLKLFRLLKPDTQERLDAIRLPIGRATGCETPENLRTGFQSLSQLLCANRDTFERWRYLYEQSFGQSFDTALIDQALTEIINAYKNTPNT